MVELTMLITTHELQRGRDHSPYLLGNVHFFYLNIIEVLLICLLGVGKILAFISSSSKLYYTSYMKKF